MVIVMMMIIIMIIIFVIIKRIKYSNLNNKYSICLVLYDQRDVNIWFHIIIASESI